VQTAQSGLGMGSDAWVTCSMTTVGSLTGFILPVFPGEKGCIFGGAGGEMMRMDKRRLGAGTKDGGNDGMGFIT
jgi:hypothetical protein